MANPSILFLIPYFGKWPFWMPFFLESCRYNPDIHWLFFTDCGVPDDAPENVHFRTISFTAYCQHVSSRLGIPFAPKSPYKLCDLKPALGLVHEDELAGYEFWGFSDIDLIYGKLRHYFSAERLARFDLLSTHERRISGHLCLMRNTPGALALFKDVPGWQDQLAGDAHVAFDEGAFSRLFLRYKNWPSMFRELFLAKNQRWRMSEFVEAYSTPYGRVPWHDGSFDFPEYWQWQQGRLTNNRDGMREFPYFHFIGWKGREDWRTEAEHSVARDPELIRADGWRITTRGFLRCE